MKQYSFRTQSYAEDIIPDAVLHDPEAIGMHDLARMQELAGISEARDKKANATYGNPGGLKSPMGSNISQTAAEIRRLEKEHNIKPGTPEWFQLWFSLPYLTGEKPVGDETAGHTNSLMSVNVTPPSR